MLLNMHIVLLLKLLSVIIIMDQIGALKEKIFKKYNHKVVCFCLLKYLRDQSTKTYRDNMAAIDFTTSFWFKKCITELIFSSK